MDGDGNFDGFSSMGFDVMHNFEEVPATSVHGVLISCGGQ
jgi:beta-N-acetylhexosaminidase